MKNEIVVALAGIGGYGELYARKLLAGIHGCVFAGAVDPFPERAKLMPELKARKTPVFPDLESLYAKSKPDLLALASPIHLHRSQTEFALSRGSNVLCEKPAAGSLADALAMQEAEKNAKGRFLAIGYQWSFSKAIIDLKADIASGKFGRPLRMRSLTLWPRPLSYYKRNSWAGAVKASNGAIVNDSPLNNACAHYLHNCLHLLGAQPDSVQADLIRANKIQNYDTVALRCLAGGVEILFYSSHASRVDLGPLCVYEFENATVSYDSKRKEFVAKFKGGSTKNYGNPEENIMKKLEDCVKASASGEKPVCRIGDALAQTRCMELAAKLEIRQAPEPEIEILDNGGNPLTTIKGLAESMTMAFAKGELLSEAGDLKWLL